MFMFFVFRTALFLDLFRYSVLGTTRCLYYKAKHKRFFLGMSKNAFVFRTALIDWEMSRFAFFWLELCLIWILRDVFVFRTLLPNTEYREYLCLVCFLLAGTMFGLNKNNKINGRSNVTLWDTFNDFFRTLMILSQVYCYYIHNRTSLMSVECALILKVVNERQWSLHIRIGEAQWARAVVVIVVF